MTINLVTSITDTSDAAGAALIAAQTALFPNAGGNASYIDRLTIPELPVVVSVADETSNLCGLLDAILGTLDPQTQPLTVAAISAQIAALQA